MTTNWNKIGLIWSSKITKTKTEMKNKTKQKYLQKTYNNKNKKMTNAHNKTSETLKFK